MTWAELLRKQLPLMKEEDINLIIYAEACPGYYFGPSAPNMDIYNECLGRECGECWNGEVPEEILAAHGMTLNETRVTLCLTPEIRTAGGVLTEDEARRVREAIEAIIKEADRGE